MEQFAVWIASINAWWLITFLITFLIAELFLQTQILLTISIALIIPAILNFLNVTHFVQLWSFPVSLFIGFFIQRKIFESTSRVKVPYFEKLEDNIGYQGIIKATKIDDQYSEDYFYSYKDKNDFDELNLRQKKSSSTVYKLQLPNGRFYSVKGHDDEVFSDGEEVEIIKVVSGQFVVKKII